MTNTVRESLAVARTNKYRWVEAWLRHALGLILAADDPRKGLEQIDIATRLAQELEMLPDVALCHWSGAAALVRCGRTAEADERRGAALSLLRRLGMATPAPTGAGEVDQRGDVPAGQKVT